MEKLVSIIVPVYNVENYLEHCVQTIINQTYRNIEIIIVDDGSTDSSGKLCDMLGKKDSRIRVVHQENRGLGGARNTGIATAKGEYICFIDSDDYISKNYIYMLLSSAMAQGSDIVVCNYRKGNSTNFCFRNSENSEVKCTMSSYDVLQKWNGINKKIETMACNKIYNKRLFDYNIRYPEDVYYEDVCTTPQLIEKAKYITFINNKLYYYYQRKGSTIHSTSDEKTRDKLYMLEQRLKWFKEHNYKQAYKRLYIKLLKHYICCYIMVDSYSLASEILCKYHKYWNESNMRMLCIDRILFSIFKVWHNVIRKIYRRIVN